MKKRIMQLFALILAACLCVPFPVYAAEAVTEGVTETTGFDESRMGDTDSDGRVTAADARFILRCSVGLEEASEEELMYGDLDRDKALTSEDARVALRVAVGLDSIKCILHGHELIKKSISPTCTEEGYTVERCKVCSFSGKRTDVTAALKHKLTEKTTPATCTENGSIITVCRVCAFVKENKVNGEATGHSWGIWQAEGEMKSRTCKSCAAAETAKNVKTIYLTFDDGPGAYTERLLGYLKEYGVKATFFVTNQFPKYRYVLKKIVDDGHGIAVHTLTHQWSIYSSKEAYLKDFDAMHKIILEETGVDTKIFRFPGGTNNTVSRSYSRGVMASAAKHMTDAGYIYFDWNVDCGDTLGYSASKIASYTINQIRGRHSAVVLMHDIKYNTVEAVRTIIKYGLDNGYTFAVLDESTPRVQFKPVN